MLNIIQTNINIDYFSWLNDKDSSFYKYFLVRIQELKEAKSRAQNEGILDLNKILGEKCKCNFCVNN